MLCIKAKLHLQNYSRSTLPEVYSVKKLILKISKNSHENTCVGVSFLDADTGIFLWVLWIFKNTFFNKTPMLAASFTRR